MVTLEQLELEHASQQASAEPRPDDITDRRMALEQLYALVQQLDPLDRQVMVCYLDGMEASAIAEIVGISGGAVAMKIHRIKRVLAARFQIVGGVIGLIGAFVPAACMVMLNRRERPGATAACVHAYEAQLARERSAVNASAITILAMMIGAGLLSVPSEGGLRAAFLSMAGPCLAGIATAWYLRRQTRQYDRRIQELRRISA